MSDTPEYEDRTIEELEALSSAIRAGDGPRNYVAKPAEGHDVHGAWHCFGTGSRSGYATHAIATHWLMSEVLGVPTQLVPHRNQDIDIERFPEDRYDRLFQWHKEAVGWPHIMLCSYPPEVAAELDGMGPPLVPYCAFEGTKIGVYMRDLCNKKAFRSVWVVSPFVRAAFLAGGVAPSRVRFVRPPLCDGPWTMGDVEALAATKARPVTPEEPFVFGALGTWQKRKGFHDLVRAYFGAFRRSDSVRLVIRTSAFGDNATIRQFKETVTKEIAEIAKEFGDDSFPSSKLQPKLQFILGTDATDQEIVEWLSSLDCYANATYGEGLGIPHVWAKANGVPMISTAYGAVGELVDKELPQHSDEVDLIVPHRLEPVDAEICRIALMFDRDSCWGVYDPKDFGSAMRVQFEDGRLFQRQSALATRRLFSAEACAPSLRAAMAEVIEPEWAEKWKLASTS